MSDQHARESIKALLRDRWWRLNNLYRIADKDGNEVVFRPNFVQTWLDDRLWYRNIVLKSRQHGVTTYACIRALDKAIFEPGAKCGLVFHKNDAASAAFITKILYAYDRLPAWLKAEVGVVKRDMNGELILSNGSMVYCSLSHRSGNLNFLHISEYGPMCELYPKRAEEVRSGALNTVTPDGIVIIESTAYGAWGDFYRRTVDSMNRDKRVQAGTEKLSQLDYKFHFFGWWLDPANRIDPTDVRWSDEDEAYFDKLERSIGQEITLAQRAWYVKKAGEQRELMLREQPSTAEEAFKVSTEGAIFGQELDKMDRQGRILQLPHIREIPVNTFWDIGRNDSNAIWFHQYVDGWHHLIDFEEDSGESAAFYASIIRNKHTDEGYIYGRHYLPHDSNVVEYTRGDNKTRIEVLKDLGVKPADRVERIQDKWDAIEMARAMLSRTKIDAVKCGEKPAGSERGGLLSLRAYRKKYDEDNEVFRNEPVKSWANHAADALQTGAQGFVHKRVAKVVNDEKQEHDYAKRKSAGRGRGWKHR